MRCAVFTHIPTDLHAWLHAFSVIEALCTTSNNLSTTYSSDTHSQSAAMPAPTLEFAAICLRNALFLVSPEIIPSCSTLPGPTLHENSVLGLRYGGVHALLIHVLGNKLWTQLVSVAKLCDCSVAGVAFSPICHMCLLVWGTPSQRYPMPLSCLLLRRSPNA